MDSLRGFLTVCTDVLYSRRAHGSGNCRKVLDSAETFLGAELNKGVEIFARGCLHDGFVVVFGNNLNALDAVFENNSLEVFGKQNVAAVAKDEAGQVEIFFSALIAFEVGCRSDFNIDVGLGLYVKCVEGFERIIGIEQHFIIVLINAQRYYFFEKKCSNEIFFLRGNLLNHLHLHFVF